MSTLVPKLTEELEAIAPVLASQVAEAEARAEAQRREREEESRRLREEQERARQAKLRQEAKDDLLAAIDAWERTRRVQDWLALVERKAQDLAEVERQVVLGRLEEARALVGGADALDLLKNGRRPASGSSVEWDEPPKLRPNVARTGATLSLGCVWLIGF
jgi:uncharacterized protein YhaN